jgi:hypothetical protein
VETLGEDLLLLAIRPNGTLAGREVLRFALAGSELVRLAARRKVDVVDGRIVMLNASPTGDDFLNSALGSIVALRKPPKAKAWVAAAKPVLVRVYLDRLVASGAIRVEESRALMVFRSTRWPVADVGRRGEVRERLVRIAGSSGTVELEDRAFAGLAHAVGLGGVVFPGRAGTGARRRLKEIARGDATSRVVVDAVVQAAISQAVEASVDAAVDAAVQAAVDAAVHASVDAAHHAASTHGGHGGGGGGHH